MSSPRLLLASLGLFASACAIQLPSPPTPARRAPSIALPADAPPAGEGRIVIETVDAPATAELITGRASAYGVAGGQVVASSQIAVRRLCTTPCVVDLPRGEHEIVLSVPGTGRAGRVVARIEERPSTLIADLGEYRNHPGKAVGGVLLLTVGVPALIAGAVWVGVDDEPGTAGYATLGLGAAASLVGALLVNSARPQVQDTSYAQYPIE